MPTPAETQIGLITDTHFWFEADSCFDRGQRQLQPHSQLFLDLLLEDLQAQHLDLILHLGDITCGGGSFGMPEPLVATTIQKVKSDLETVGCPVGMVPGNHDCRLGYPYDDTSELLGLTPDLGTSYTFPASKLHIELIHAQAYTPEEIAEGMREHNDPVRGRVAPAEINRQQYSLQAAAGLNVLVGCHQLLVPMSSWRESVASKMQVANSPEVLQPLAQHGHVQAIFQGHTHAYDVHQLPLGSGTCTAVVVPALIMWPVSWLLLTANPQGFAWEVKPLPVPEELLAQSKAQVERDQPPGLPAWDPWRIDFPQ